VENDKAVSEFGGTGRTATRRASQREARHLEARTLPTTMNLAFAAAQTFLISDLRRCVKSEIVNQNHQSHYAFIRHRFAGQFDGNRKRRQSGQKGAGQPL
jgi:hypothetical protein